MKQISFGHGYYFRAAIESGWKVKKARAVGR